MEFFFLETEGFAIVLSQKQQWYWPEAAAKFSRHCDSQQGPSGYPEMVPLQREQRLPLTLQKVLISKGMDGIWLKKLSMPRNTWRVVINFGHGIFTILPIMRRVGIPLFWASGFALIRKRRRKWCWVSHGAPALEELVSLSRLHFTSWNVKLQQGLKYQKIRCHAEKRSEREIR